MFFMSDELDKDQPATWLTDERQQDWQEDEPVSRSDQDDPEVHAEVKDLEDLRLGERQDDDPAELGQRDPGQNLKY